MAGVGQPQGSKRHGLDLGAIEFMRRQQDNGCAICGKELGLVPEVDHDHALAKLHPHPDSVGCKLCVRALLCKNCNVMLGHAKDDIDTLYAAISYLVRWSGRVG